MDTISDDTDTLGSDFYFAKLSLVLAIRQTHGRAFSSAFLEEYRHEIRHAFEEAHARVEYEHVTRKREH